MIVILYSVLGILLLRNIIKTTDILENIFLGFGIGNGILTIVSTALLICDLSINTLNLLLPLVLLVSLVLFWKHRQSQADNFIQRRKVTFQKNTPLLIINSIMTIAILAIVFSVVFSLVEWPIHAWDSLTLYDFRGKMLSQGNGLNFFSGLSKRYYFSYPLLSSVLHATTYLHSGVLVLKLFYAIYFLGFVYIFFRYLVENDISIVFSLFLTLVLISNPLIFRVSKITYTNLIHIFYIFIGTTLLYQWFKDKLDKYLYLSSIFFLISVQVRIAEYFYLIPIIFLLIMWLFNKISFKHIVQFSIPVISSVGVWKIVSSSVNLKSDVEVETLFDIISTGVRSFSAKRFLDVANFYITSLAPIYLPLIIFLILTFLGSVIFCKKITNEKIYLLYSILATFALLFIGNYFISYSYPTWRKISYSLQRAALVTLPLSLFFGSLTINNLFKSKNL